MDQIWKRLGNLLTIKSLITLSFTALFAVEIATNGISGEQFLDLYQMVVVFYFGTQVEKISNNK